VDDKLHALGITASALARYYGVSARTVYDWRHSDCPDYVARHIGILMQYNQALDEIRKA